MKTKTLVPSREEDRSRKEDRSPQGDVRAAPAPPR